jgi:hypothetical protein
MNIEVTRGRSEIYDVLTHLTFLFIESHKIMSQVLINEGKDVNRDWKKLESAALKKGKLSKKDKEIALTHTANFLGRTFEEVSDAYPNFATKTDPNRFLKIIYYLGKLAINEVTTSKKRIITFSPVLRERLGQHIHGEIWASGIKKKLDEINLLERPIHIISANMHSVMNTIYSPFALTAEHKKYSAMEIYEMLSDSNNTLLREKVMKYAAQNGLIYIKDNSGTNINVQIIDTAKLPNTLTNSAIDAMPVLIVMDYAFGEQAFETLDELLKPYKKSKKIINFLDVKSVSIMGKAGILEGGKGDIMLPSAHVFEGTADNYPFKNMLKKSHFEGEEIKVCKGAMITVLGTSLQNKDILKFFKNSTWNVVGLEMEGAHYQKAIQSASKIRRSISSKVKVQYAYYASDNPLETGGTLASGGLGTSGVKPTYLITEKMLNQILV